MDYYGTILTIRIWNDKTPGSKPNKKPEERMGTRTMCAASKEKCPNQEENMKNCNCSYNPCSRKGICCECIAYHRSSGELPACYFPDSVEKSYDRSILRFIRVHQK